MSDTCDFLDAAYWMISKDDISKIYLSRVIVTLAFRAAPCDDFDDLASTRRRRRLGAYWLVRIYDQYWRLMQWGIWIICIFYLIFEYYRFTF